MRLVRLLQVLLVGVPLSLSAQHNAKAALPATTPSAEASQFDFLVGQWDLSVRPKVPGLAARIHGSPKLLGTWKAWKALDGFGVQDELRIVDGSGNPNALSMAVRVWSGAERKWVVTTVDAYRGRVSGATASMANGEMQLMGRSTDATGKGTLSRSFFRAITPASFRFVQDRSSDDGKTWDEAVLVIEAKRVSANAAR